ncbi:Crp/Fnr family transcriptional regulator [Vibrio sp.]|uniref:Crp/Fnr family transcriptional regulator n=1 Tax=Vibrio sp. TaxID=678 RepID=UPI003D0C23E6
MDNRFLTQLTDQGFSQEQISQLRRVASELELPTRHVLIQQGDEPEHIYLLLDGICHASYLTETGKAFSKEFYWENDWVIGYEALIKQQPSPFLLETLTPATLICIPIDTLRQWRAEQHAIYYKLLETQLMYKEHKERFMLLHTPAQRYTLFREHYPELLDRLTDYQIAAYLGITSISLSRIKSRLNKG